MNRNPELNRSGLAIRIGIRIGIRIRDPDWQILRDSVEKMLKMVTIRMQDPDSDPDWRSGSPTRMRSGWRPDRELHAPEAL